MSEGNFRKNTHRAVRKNILSVIQYGLEFGDLRQQKQHFLTHNEAKQDESVTAQLGIEEKTIISSNDTTATKPKSSKR